tara:strand:+ start:24198 stop:25019 length:822 start_codon:yes stop_codon:yes gene_type:complete
MSADNLRIWNSLCKTDPKHTKGFKRAGGFAGTAVKPIWQTLRLTEQFGPAGTGWGMDEPTFQTVNAGEEILVFCTVGLWYREGETMARVYGVGGDKVLGKNKYGPFTNDEAFKASYTDALSNAMKQIGVAADIHMGLFDDDKYVAATKREFEQGDAPPPPGPKQSSANGRALASQEPQLIAKDRQKGTLPAAQGTTGQTPQEAREAKIKAATDKRINALKSVTGWTRATLDQFWADNTEWIEWMSDPANGALTEYERFSAVFADAEVNMREAA